jgi:hypothetical protein
VVAALLVVTAACGGGADESGASKRNDKNSGPQRPSTENPGCKYIVARTEKRETTPGPPLQFLTSPVAEPFACYDRVSFQFSPEYPVPGATTTTTVDGTPVGTCSPAYTVEYREKPFGLLGPDKKPVTTSVAGFKDAKFVLYVEIKPAIAVSEYSTHPDLAYPGGLRLAFQQSAMNHVVMVEWVKNLPEGEQTTAPTTTVPGAAPIPQRVVWLIGLDKKRPFTVDCSPGATLDANGQPRDPACGEDRSCTHFNVLIMK